MASFHLLIEDSLDSHCETARPDFTVLNLMELVGWVSQFEPIAVTEVTGGLEVRRLENRDILLILQEKGQKSRHCAHSSPDASWTERILVLLIAPVLLPPASALRG